MCSAHPHKRNAHSLHPKTSAKTPDAIPRTALTRRPRRNAAAAAPFSLGGAPFSLDGAVSAHPRKRNANSLHPKASAKTPDAILRNALKAQPPYATPAGPPVPPSSSSALSGPRNIGGPSPEHGRSILAPSSGHLALQPLLQRLLAGGRRPVAPQSGDALVEQRQGLKIASARSTKGVLHRFPRLWPQELQRRRSRGVSGELPSVRRFPEGAPAHFPQAGRGRGQEP